MFVYNATALFILMFVCVLCCWLVRFELAKNIALFCFVEMFSDFSDSKLLGNWKFIT
ncbi:hypothetical protein Hanom_Chr10g00909151 [Helianthus anomalus]